MTHDTPATRAKRSSQSNLFLTSTRTREHQVRNVRTRNQQHESNRAHHDPQRRVVRAHGVGNYWKDRRAPTLVGLGKLLLESRRDVVQLSLRTHDRSAGFESAEHVVTVIAAAFHQLRRHCERRIDFRTFRKVETLRHDADNSARNAVDGDRLVKNVWVAAEASLPETVSDDSDGVLAGLILFRKKGATHDRLHAGRVEKVCCN